MTEPRLTAAMHIRRAGPDDAEAIVATAIKSPSAPCWTLAHYTDLLSPNQEAPLTRAVWLAEGRGTTIGFAVLSLLVAVQPPEAELESIAVAPEARRTGTGRALLAAVAAWAATRGADRLRLEARCGNRDALAFYTALGFECTGRRRGYYAAPVEDAVCMERML